MTQTELQELIDIRFKGRPALLAGELAMSEAAVRLWLRGKRGIHGGTQILLQGWLDDARKKNVKAKPR